MGKTVLIQDIRKINKVIKDMPKLDFKLLFLVDDDINKQREKFEGYDVVSNVNIKKHDIDAVIITSVTSYLQCRFD